MIEKLFSSKVLFDILVFFFKNEDRFYSTVEIIKHTGRKQVNVLRELEKLTKWGMIKKNKQGNQNYYALNQDFLQIKELSALFVSVKNNSGRKYVLINEEAGPALLSLNYFYRGFSCDVPVKQGILNKQLDILAHHKGNYAWFYFEQEALEYGTKESLKKLLEDPSFVNKLIYPKTKVLGEEALEIFQDLNQSDFKVSASEAVKLVDKFSEIIVNQIGLNTLAVFDLKDYIFTNYIKKYLEKKIQDSGLILNVVMEKLLEPVELTCTQQLRSEMLDLAWKIKTTNIHSESGLENIQKKWQWLNYGYRGPVLSREFFEDILSMLLSKSVGELEKEIRELNNRSQLVSQEKEKIFKQLKIDDKHKNFINALSALSFLKVYRKDISFLLIFLTHQLLAQFNSSLQMDELHCLTLEEAKDLILGKLSTDKSALKIRMQECVTFGSKDNLIYTGEKARKILEDHAIKDDMFAQNNQSGVKLLDGTTACLGRTGNWIYGKVRIVNFAEDMKKMQQGDILISVATTPDIVPAMKKAGAIVTDHGGITSHAAIVSRELNVPCLIGTKYATKLFKDDDAVVVCPRHGYIKFQ